MVRKSSKSPILSSFKSSISPLFRFFRPPLYRRNAANSTGLQVPNRGHPPHLLDLGLLDILSSSYSWNFLKMSFLHGSGCLCECLMRIGSFSDQNWKRLNMELYTMHMVTILPIPILRIKNVCEPQIRASFAGKSQNRGTLT